MARGGYRPGAGRPRKSGDGQVAKKAKAAKIAFSDDAPLVEVPEGQVSPLEYLLGVVNDVTAEPADRMRAAVSAAPYVHAKASDVIAAKGKKEQKQEAAEQVAGAGRFAPRRGPRLAVDNG